MWTSQHLGALIDLSSVDIQEADRRGHDGQAQPDVAWYRARQDLNGLLVIT